MKTTKRILSIALALLLALALLAPMAFAEDETDPNAPVIDVQPQEIGGVKVGKTFTLTVQARLPEGVDGTLSYQWINAASGTSIATGTSATLTAVFGENGIGDDDLENPLYSTSYYYVVVTNTYEEGGVTKTASTQSETVTVTVINTLRGAGLRYFWFGSLLVSALIFPMALGGYLLFVFNSIMYSFI